MGKIIVANWKMCGDTASSKKWTENILADSSKFPSGSTVVVCPPAPLLPIINYALRGSAIKLGGQDCHFQQEGAYTGETSAKLLKDIGCGYVIVGHSERRAGCGETDAIVNAKAASAIKNGLIPIICIGETQVQRENGETIEVINRQITESIPDVAAYGNFILAYEPVWAIGSGKIPSMDEIQQVHNAIITSVSKRSAIDIGGVYVLYGGSVKPANAREILALDNVAGVLVGGASLDENDFAKIIMSCPE